MSGLFGTRQIVVNVGSGREPDWLSHTKTCANFLFTEKDVYNDDLTAQVGKRNSKMEYHTVLMEKDNIQ